MPTKATRNGHIAHVTPLVRNHTQTVPDAAGKLLDDVAAKNREWIIKAPLIVDPDSDNTAPVMVRLNLAPDVIGCALVIAMRSNNTVEDVLGACLNNGVDIVELSNDADKPAELAKIGL